MNVRIKKVLLFKLLFLTFIALTLISGCTVTLVSKYDEQTDANVTALQKKFDAYFLKLQGAPFPDCSYNANKIFFDDIKVQLSSAQIRANAIPQNDLTLQQIDALAKAISDLETNQKKRDDKKTCLPDAIINADRTMFNSIFTAILKFELAKKRGDSK